MSLLSITPDIVAGASGNLQDLGSALWSANAAAAAQTTSVAAPAADEVSSAIAALLGEHGREYQALSAEAAAFHQEFVNLLNGGAARYVNAEAANVQQALNSAVNAPAQALLGHPLMGTAAKPAATASKVTSSGDTATKTGSRTITTGKGTVTPYRRTPIGNGTIRFGNDTISINNGVITLGVTANRTIGPFGVSLNQTATPTLGGLSGVTTGSLTLTTPFGPAPVLSGSGIEYVAFNGAFGLTLSQTAPFPLGISMNGFLGGTGSPRITGLTLDLLGATI